MGEAEAAAGATRPLHVFSSGFLRQARIRRILELSGWDVSLGWPGRDGAVAVWGRKRTSLLGRAVARQTSATLLTVEDGFLRSVQPGVTGEPPVSLIFDPEGIYYDAGAPSRLERMIETGSGLDGDLLDRARQGMARLMAAGLSKYSPVGRGQAAVPERGYHLVIDQTAGDASIGYGGASAESFTQMLEAARVEAKGRRIVIRTHPDVLTGRKRGHFTAEMLRSNEVLFSDPANPWDVIEGAETVCAVTSQMGFEALLAGRKVRLFGLPFYAGWGLTEDAQTLARRTARPSIEAVFAAAYLQHATYYDPWRDRLCSFEETVAALEFLAPRLGTETTHKGEVYAGFHPWKRTNTLRYARRHRRHARFIADPDRALSVAKAEGRRVWFWASKYPPETLDRARTKGVTAGLVEDGFLRSVGLGASLIDAASLVFDDLGIYYDPGQPSRLEALIAAAADLPADGPECRRAAALRGAIVAARVTKYNVGEAARPDLPAGRPVVLVPGQVEDDASIRRGTGEVQTNLGLLRAVRAARPEAAIIYKPHPDVEAGLRQGKVSPADAAALADDVAERASAADLLDLADEVWTMTSLMGFEALLRGKDVTCLGMPFYAGWGLTEDLGVSCPRRTARVSLDQLVHAALVAYPAYLDPLSRLPCPPEVAVARLAERHTARGGWGQRAVSKAQGMMAVLGLVWWR